jgi:fructoselysine-6-P-deglycase FrlB-like protein
MYVCENGVMSHFAEELRSQPELWRRAARLARDGTPLPAVGERVALIGCGTSLYVAQAVARYREIQGLGETDAFPASEFPANRAYDTLVAVSRSGTTTEVVRAVASVSPHTRVVVVTATEDSPLARAANDLILLSFADEESIVQTRFATSTLALILASLGWDIETSAEQAVAQLATGAPRVAEDTLQFVFLGRGMAAAIASEAALKMREVLGAWTEAYPTMEFRHGPISALTERSLVWVLDHEEPSIDEQIERTGARLFRPEGDPLVELVRVHLVAEHLASVRGIDVDRPRFLTRSVVL